MTRIGKIARLPKDVREVVNRRLDDGHPAKDIAGWLNEQPEVKAVLEKEFDGEPVNESNMHRWVDGGYLDWKKASEREAHRADNFACLINHMTVTKSLVAPDFTDNVGVLLAAALAGECARLDGIEDNADRVKALRDLMGSFAQLRGAELDGGKLNLERQKLEEIMQAFVKRQKELDKPRLTPEQKQARIRQILGTE